MKNFSNTYIFVFAAVMVTIVAILLSFASIQLKPRQQLNIELERKHDILRSVGQAQNMEEAEDKAAYMEEEFNKYFKESIVVNFSGEVLESDAFEVTLNLNAEIAKDPEEREYPLFVYEGEDGTKLYVVPVRGKGLWGPIWGYIALRDDLNTIYGAVFDHEKETPGLGAEINTDWFQANFKGKTLFDDQGNFVSIDVVKGGAQPDDPHGVDAISGGTITSKALEAMLKNCLTGYVNYFKTIGS